MLPLTICKDYVKSLLLLKKYVLQSTEWIRNLSGGLTLPLQKVCQLSKLNENIYFFYLVFHNKPVSSACHSEFCFCKDTDVCVRVYIYRSLRTMCSLKHSLHKHVSIGLYSFESQMKENSERIRLVSGRRASVDCVASIKLPWNISSTAVLKLCVVT